MDESAWETVVVGTWTTGTPLYGGRETGDITHGTAAEGDHQTVPGQGARLHGLEYRPDGLDVLD